VLVKSKVAEHVDGREEETGRIGSVLSLNITGNVTAAGLVHGILASQISSRNNTGASHESSTNVGENVAVQVTTENNVKLVRFGDELECMFRNV
jgi:hypothetical protein